MTEQREESPAEGGLKEGIYLEKKKGVIGTGHTAKPAEYDNFWATGRIGDKSAVMVLLDDEFKPTGIKETFRFEVLTGPGWFFIDQGEKKYQRLRPHLDKLFAPPPPAPTAPAAAKTAAPPKAAGPAWWSGQESGPPQDPFARPGKAAAKSPPPKKGGWWDK